MDGLQGFTLDELNDHFAAVSFSTAESSDNATEVIKRTPVEGFSFQPVSVNDVIFAVAYFTSQARGEDGIPQSVVAKPLPTISLILVKIFNSSLEPDVSSGTWKNAQLLPLQNKSAPSSLSEFCPIALLYFLSKVLKKLAHDQLIEYIV